MKEHTLIPLLKSASEKFVKENYTSYTNEDTLIIYRAMLVASNLILKRELETMLASGNEI